MSIIGCYSLHLYCCCASCSRNGGGMREYEGGFIEIGGEETRTLSMRAARARGWRIDRKGNRAWAPRHAKKSTDRPAYE